MLWALATGLGFWWMPVWLSISRVDVHGRREGSGWTTCLRTHIAWVFRCRHTPVSQLSVHRLSLGGQANSYYVYVQDDIFGGS